MATSITTKIALDGEKEYKRAISEINSALGVMQSEMRKTSAEYQDNADSMDALQAKGDVLERTLATQQEKVEALRQALQNAGESFGEADKRTNYWQMALNKAEAAVYDTESAIRKNNEALEEAESSYDKAQNATEEYSDSMDEAESSHKKLGSALKGLSDKLGIDLPEGAQKALESMDSLQGGSILAVAAIGGIAGAVIQATKALIDMTTESAAYADSILTLSAQTGLGTQTLQEFSYAAELVDVDVETIQSSLTKLTNNMQDAANGTGTAKDAFDKLGISVTDSSGNLRDAESVFYEAIDRLGEMENATERDALAMDIMGRSAQDLNPLILQGSDGLKRFADEANSTGYVLDEFSLQKLGAVDDGFQRMKTQMDTTKNKLAVEFAPYLTKALDGMASLIGKVGDALVESGAVEAFGSILDSVVRILDPLLQLSSTILPLVELALEPVVWLLDGIADVIDWIMGGISKINGSTVSVNVDQNTIDTINGSTSGYNASGTDFWRGGWTWVGENGPERVYLPRGSQVQNAQESRLVDGDVINVYVDAKNVKELNDLIRIAKNAKFKGRMEAK